MVATFGVALSIRSVHGSDWVELKEFFLPNSPWWVKKNSTQPNPSHKSNLTQPNARVSGWTYGLDKFIIIIIIIIIKLSRKKI